MMALYVSISHHGFGHLAQTAAILQALRADRPHLRLIVQSALPFTRLAARLPAPFEHWPEAAETAFEMFNALHVDVSASRAAFAAFHQDYGAKVARLAARLQAAEVSTVLSNVAYLPLAAAQHLGLPNYAVCSLNWAAIYAHYLGRDAVWQTMHAAYAAADIFFCPQPSMPMPDLYNLQTVAPLAQFGTDQRPAIAARLAAAGVPSSASSWWVVGMGGFGWQAPPDFLPVTQDVLWWVPEDWPWPAENVRRFEAAGVSFADLLASCDGLVTKPGYGSFVESACMGLDVIYLSRPDWPESEALTTWLARHARTAVVPAVEVGNAGALSSALARVARQKKPPRPVAEGARAIASPLLVQR